MKYNIVLSVLLILCLAPMPYGYYELIRFIGMVTFGVMSYKYSEKNNVALAVMFGILALLFQPFVKIALGRIMWNIVDVIVAVLLIIVLIMEKREKG